MAEYMAMATAAGALQRGLHEPGARTVMADTAVQFAAPGAVSGNVMCYAEAPACPASKAAHSSDFTCRLYLWGILDHAQHDLRLEERLGQLWILHQNLPGLQRSEGTTQPRPAVECIQGVAASIGTLNRQHQSCLYLLP